MTQEIQTVNIDAAMAASATLLQFLLMLVAGWLQRQQAATIDYLKAENRMLRERLGGRRIVFTDCGPQIFEARTPRPSKTACGT